MRKILLATTALVGFAVAGAAHAATSPLEVTIGGSTDFVAGAFHQSKASTVAVNGQKQNSDDFETLYELNFGVAGKMGAVQYGGKLSLNNFHDIANLFGSANNQSLYVTDANIFLSSTYGKVVLGDSRGATDLFLRAPSVGEGQANGRYIDFLDTYAFAKNFVTNIDGVDHSTNITYFTPKVGNDMHKVQAGVTFTPQFYDFGANTVKYKNNNIAVGDATSDNEISPYKNVIKGAANYTGTFKPVTVGVSAGIMTGNAYNSCSVGQAWIANAPQTPDDGVDPVEACTKVRDFTAWDVGANVAAEGFTVGGSYTDLGHYNTVGAQNRSQALYQAGVKYEFNKYGVAFNYLGGEGYGNILALPTTKVGSGRDANYVRDFGAYGFGGTYTWASGLTTNLDGVFYNQKTQSNVKNDGYVFLVSQKLAF